MPKHKTLTPTPSPIKRPPLLRIGPGLIIAIVLSLIIGIQWKLNEHAAEKQRNLPPIVERPVVSSNEEKLGLTPEVSFILQRKEMLKLTKVQTEQLVSLQAEWRHFADPREKAAIDAANAAGQYLNNAQNQRRTPVAHIEDQTHGVVVISRELSAARRRFWSKALTVLTPPQQQLVQHQREVEYARQHQAFLERMRSKQRE
jgi:hypothetical protein